MKRNLALLLVLSAVFVLPVGILALYGVSMEWTFPQVWPARFGSRSVSYVVHQWREISRSLAWSLLYSFLTAGLSFLICLWPAQVFAYEQFRGQAVLEGALLAPALAPAMTFSMGVHFLFIKLGLADNPVGVVLVLTVFTYPYMLRTLVSGYMSFGEDYRRCAKNLGAGPWMRLVRVDIPLLMPAAVAGGTVVFLIAFSEYYLVFLIGGGAVPSFSGYLFPFLNSSDHAVASVLTLIFLAVPIILFILLDAAVARIYRRMGLY